ncbi:hypothetical protein DFP94_1011189 [Fontibacillus phaseoli]|uniref:Prenylated flavin chaperone LpdD-like domain-containing protein n=1 Tax=Fontibacillus phaseoli TaxID=1416533 RepID=A0A369BPP6_9BACL|nr:hypothetical protein [Fontibacillus phaseoli]RCX23590.1 hypothetical protein DFP94_1011189 [Fontibacillus phaseoli]
MNSFDDIKLQVIPMGRDLLLTMTGGEAHIGAASTAYLTEQGIEVQTSALPGHKEHVLTAGLAKRAAEYYQRTVTVVMGIHYDGLNREEIQQISQITKSLLEQLLAESRTEGSL